MNYGNHSPNLRLNSFALLLGDIMDEGLWCSKPEFDNYIYRFKSIFKVPDNVPLKVVPGNHDMGFHYG